MKISARIHSDFQQSLKIFSILISMTLLLLSGEFSVFNSLAAAVSDDKSSAEERCITYNRSERTITIGCGSNIHLSDIHNKLQDHNVLDRQPDGIWLLNSGISIDKGATLIIDSQDTKWLKIIADGTNAYPITVLGSLKIDSVRVTSWNPQTNSYAISKGNRDFDDQAGKYKVIPGFPRPYIRIEGGATGSTNITNSEIAYLGYEAGLGGGKTGLTYLGGDNSVLRNNKIHDLYFAFYSSGVGGMVIESNHIYNNGHYGLDPHTGTHDMTIRNNTVHDNGAIGIICSLNCSKIIIESNKAYSNDRMGIMLSRNVQNSVVRNNIVYNETQCIFASQSHNNEINNNYVRDCKNGIHLFHNSSANSVHHNTIGNSVRGIFVDNGATENTIYSNTITSTSNNTTSPSSNDNNNQAIVVDEAAKGNTIRDNKVVNY
jgi:poly(beta-D-mannuronate) C5 epimerase